MDARARGSSLLPAGVRAVASEFNSARRIAGRRADEIEAILGWRGRTEMVHRDDLVLF